MPRIQDKDNKETKSPKELKKMKGSSDDESDSDWVPELNGKEDDTLKMQKFMQKMFPSKAGNERLKKLKKINTLKTRTSKRLAMNKLKKLKKNDKEDKKTEDTSSDEEDSFVDDEYDTENDVSDGSDDYDEEEDDEDTNMKFNIVFTVNEDGKLEHLADEEEDEEEDEYDESENTDAEDVFDNTLQFKEGDIIIAKEQHWDNSYRGIITKVLSNNKYNIKLCDKDLDRRNWKNINKKSLTLVHSQKEEEDYVKALKEIKELVNLKKKGKGTLLKKMDELTMVAEKKREELELQRNEKRQKKNGNMFKKLLNNKSSSNDFKFFNTLNIDKQKSLLTVLKEIGKHNNVDRPYRIKLLESDIPLCHKAMALKKVNILNNMDPGSGEYYKIKQWVDGFMQIPFGKYTELPIKIDDGREKCSKFMDTAMEELNSAVYGLNDAKMQILQYLGQLIANPSSVGSAIGICGPPGTGKTTMLRALSAILKRPFTLIAAGGASDGSVFEGHAYTYEGSKPGKFVETIIQLQTMNPIFGVDELDKLSNTPRGEEVSGIFTHAIDTTFNDKFEDKYYSSIKLDLSKAIWVFTYNDESRINPILADRMYKIHTDGYNTKEKVTIAKEYLIPKIEKNINFNKDDIIFSEEVLTNIIDNYTDGEKGVRNLKRCLEIIFTKINLFKMMSPKSKLFDDEEILEITENFEITNDIIKTLIKKQDVNKTPFGLYL